MGKVKRTYTPPQYKVFWKRHMFGAAYGHKNSTWVVTVVFPQLIPSFVGGMVFSRTMIASNKVLSPTGRNVPIQSHSTVVQFLKSAMEQQARALKRLNK